MNKPTGEQDNPNCECGHATCYEFFVNEHRFCSPTASVKLQTIANMTRIESNRVWSFGAFIPTETEAIERQMMDCDQRRIGHLSRIKLKKSPYRNQFWSIPNAY